MNIKDAKRILITRTDRLGDVVLSTPVIRLMRKLFPEAYIAFMVRPENRDVVMNNPHLDSVIEYDKYGAQKSLPETIKFAMGLRRWKFDMVIALHPTNRVHLMTFLAGIPLRIGYNRNMSFLLTKKINHLKQEGLAHEVDYNLDMISQCGMDISGADRKPYMEVSEDDGLSADNIFKDHNIGGNVIALHPGASCRSKRWSSENFALIGDMLAEEYVADIVIVGGKGDEFGEKIVASMKHRAVDLTGKLTVGGLAGFLSRCRLFVSNDSGPVHVAVAVSVPVIAVFGRKSPGLSPERWGPLGKDDLVLHKDVGCEECLAHNCELDFSCLKAVTAEEVMGAAVKILGSPDTSGVTNSLPFS